MLFVKMALLQLFVLVLSVTDEKIPYNLINGYVVIKYLNSFGIPQISYDWLALTHQL